VSKLHVTEERLRQAEQERDEAQRWRDEAVRACAKRDCAGRDRRLPELERENAALREELACHDCREHRLAVETRARTEMEGWWKERDALRAKLEALRKALDGYARDREIIANAEAALASAKEGK
jgi:hypothetical protein